LATNYFVGAVEAFPTKDDGRLGEVSSISRHSWKSGVWFCRPGPGFCQDTQTADNRIIAHSRVPGLEFRASNVSSEHKL
jgi:hypothetical protein